MSNFIKTLLLTVVIVSSIVVVNTMKLVPDEQVVPKPVAIKVNQQQAINHLADILKFQTISNQDPELMNGKAFTKMRSYLEQTYPLVFATLDNQIINQYSLLFKWQGKNPQLKPILLLAHQDVVPVAEENRSSWTHPPFAGVIDEHYIWGRGALDDKSSLVAIFESITLLLNEDFQPERTYYFAFGHDEEIGGTQGAAKIAQLLKSQNIELEFVLDEGGLIADGLIPGIEPAVALVGIAEKGYVSLKLSIKQEGGHSSMPPKQTAIGYLSQAIVALEANPLPADSSQSMMLFSKIAPYMSFTKRLVFANTWLTGSLIEKQLANNKLTNSMIRTTTATTMINAGVKENVLPVSATAIVNFRILPGDTPESVRDFVIKVIGNPDIKVTPTKVGREPSKVSNHQSDSFKLLEKTIHQANGGGKALVVAPYLVMAGTDSRNFEIISDDIYRFLFNYAVPDDVKRIHSIDERISKENFIKVIGFYFQLIKNSDDL